MSGNVGRKRRRKLRLSHDTREKLILTTSPTSTNYLHAGRRNYNQVVYYVGFDGGGKASCKKAKNANIIGSGFFSSAGGRCIRCFKAMLGRALGFMRCVGDSNKEIKQVTNKKRRRRRRRSNNVDDNVTTIRVSASPYVYDSHHAQAMEDCIEFVNSFYKDKR